MTEIAEDCGKHKCQSPRGEKAREEEEEKLLQSRIVMIK